MKETTEMEVRVLGGRILKTEIKPDGSCKLIVGIESAKDAFSDTAEFKKIKASELSIHDPLMRFEPFKSVLVPVIQAEELKDFFIPGMDPSFDGKGGIHYVPGEKPALGQSWNWWNKTAKNFIPERKSRLGTKVEYTAFLAVLVKKLIDSGWSFDEAIYGICHDSKKLSHHGNPANDVNKFEPTGSRATCGFCDLTNTYKMLAEDIKTGGFWGAGGVHLVNSYYQPLASFAYDTFSFDSMFGVGWIVLEK